MLGKSLCASGQGGRGNIHSSDKEDRDGEYGSVYWGRGRRTYKHTAERKIPDAALIKQAKEKVEAKFIQLSSKENQNRELLAKATDFFVKQTKAIVDYYSVKVDNDSYIFEYQWDELMAQIPKAVLSMKSSCGDVAAKKIAGKLLEISLKYVQTEDAKKELISFGEKSSIDFVVPKPKEVNEKKNLF